MTKKTRYYREPTRDELRLIWNKTPLVDIFDDSKTIELMDRARRILVSIVHKTTEWSRGKYRRTDNYVVGVGANHKNLAQYTISRLRYDFVAECDLPWNTDGLSPANIDKIVNNLQFRLLLAQINDMCQNADLWYDESLGIWQTSQRCHDAMLEEYKRAKHAYKFDKREWHGRPRRQARRRKGTIREGDSIGYKKMR